MIKFALAIHTCIIFLVIGFFVCIGPFSSLRIFQEKNDKWALSVDSNDVQTLQNCGFTDTTHASRTNTRIGKVTAQFGEAASEYQRALQTHKMHARIHGYPLFLLEHKIIDDLWNKPAYILSLLLTELEKPPGERLEWLLWFDRDTIVLNQCIPVDVFIPPTPYQHIVVTDDFNGLNNGVFLVRVNTWSVQLFSAILGFRHYRPEIDLPFTEQSAMEILLKESEFQSNYTKVPQRWFNAYQRKDTNDSKQSHVRPADFLVHFAGVENRLRVMRHWLDIAEEHSPKWEVGLGQTLNGLGNVKTYWQNHDV